MSAPQPRAPGLPPGIGALVRAAAPSGHADSRLTAWSAVGMAAHALLMTGMCLMACVVPMRRALSVEPTEALRAEG